MDKQRDGGTAFLSELRELSSFSFVSASAGTTLPGAPEVFLMEVEELARLLGRLQRLQGFLRQRLGQLELNLDLVATELAGRLKQKNLNSLEIPDLGQVVTTRMLSARVNPMRREAAYRWLAANGHSDLIRPAVNSSSLSARMKRHLQAGGAKPSPELIGLVLKVRARLVSLSVSAESAAAVQQHEQAA